MLDSFMLSFIIFIPLSGAIAIALFCKEYSNEMEISNNKTIRHIAMWCSFACLLFVMLAIFYFDSSLPMPQFVESHKWIQSTYDIKYLIGLDGVSIPFVLLTSIVTPCAIILGTKNNHQQIKKFIITILLTESLTLGLFLSLDILLFYVFFEAILIPIFLLIGIWGSDDKIKVAFRFFMYSFVGSLFLLASIIYILYVEKTTDLIKLIKDHHFAPQTQMWLWLGFFISFAVKLPLMPVHIWQPKVYSQAPTIATVMLAGTLKVGGYGFVRFLIPLFPYASQQFSLIPVILGLVGIVYASIVALGQTNMKKMVVYATIAHMGIVAVGCFSLNVNGVEGSIFTMVSQGFTTAAILLLLGRLYEHLGNYEIKSYGGLVNRMPRYVALFLVYVMAFIGLPGTAPFVGELLIILGAMNYNIYVASIAALTVILSAAYMLYMYKNVFLGGITKEVTNTFKQLNSVEIMLYSFFAIVIILCGIYPNILLNLMHSSVSEILTNYGTL